jgi:hypothetical protein
MAWIGNGGPDPSWPHLAISPSPRAWPRWHWWPSTTTQTHLPPHRPPSSGQTRHRHHHRVRQETPTNNLGVYAHTGTQRTTLPKTDHAITHHEPELRGTGPPRRHPPSMGCRAAWSITNLPLREIPVRPILTEYSRKSQTTKSRHKTTHKTPGSFSSSPQAGRRGRGPARRSSSAPTV